MNLKNIPMGDTNTKKAAFIFIFITVILDMLGIGMIIPILPKLVVSFVNGSASEGAKIYGLFGTTWAIMQFFSSPILGALSDRFGRRPVILLSNFGLGLDYILMYFAPTLAWLFAGRVISGITSASMGAANAYIADVTEPSKRAGAFGMLGAAFGVGFILGPAVGGILGSVDARLPFAVAAALSLCNALYGYFVLPESLLVKNRSPFLWKNANPLGSLKLFVSHKSLIGMGAINFFNQLSNVVFPSTFVLYASYRYSWDEKKIGICLAGVGVSFMIVQALLVKPIVAKIGERNTMLLGGFMGIMCFAIYGLAENQWAFFIGIPFAALWGIMGPALQSLMTAQVGPQEQGQLQGANGSLVGISNLLGPLLFTLTFSYFVADSRAIKIPGASFFLAGAILALALLMVFVFVSPSRTETSKSV